MSHEGEIRGDRSRRVSSTSGARKGVAEVGRRGGDGGDACWVMEIRARVGGISNIVVVVYMAVVQKWWWW
jgi:hypothetical protein